MFSSLGPTSLFVGSRLSKTSENTFYKHTKIAFIRRISNFGPNKITRFRKFFHRTHHFQPFSAVLTTSKKSPGKVSGNFKAVRTNFIHHALFTTASTIGKNTLPEIDPLVPGVILRIESAGRRLVNGDGTDVDPNPVAVDFVDHCRRQRTGRVHFDVDLPDGRLDTQRSKPDYGRASLLAQKRGGIFAVDEIERPGGIIEQIMGREIHTVDNHLFTIGVDFVTELRIAVNLLPCPLTCI